MSAQLETWYRGATDMMARAGFSVVMCGALAAAIYATHHGSAPQQSAAVVPAPRIATVVASFEESPGISRSQAVVDASPGASLLPVNIPIPLARVAEVRSAPARHVSPSVRKAVRDPVTEAPEVVSFESCLPGCETQDPLIVGRDAPAPDAALISHQADMPVETASVAEPGPGILGMALGAPRAVYQTGRHALTSLVETAF